MSTQYFQCPRCNARNTADSRFCSTCGTAYAPNPMPNIPQQNFAAPPRKSNFTALWIVVGVLGLCGFCGLIGVLNDKKDQTKNESNSTQLIGTNNQTNANAAQATPTPPLTLAELKAKAQPLLKMPDRAEYTSDELKPFDEVMKPLREIPKESKDYKEAQKLFDQLNNKVSVLMAEIVVLGPKPINSTYDGNVTPAQNYLKQALNDYDSSEYLGWTTVQKTYVGKEPFWTTTVRLRAKNAFGAFVVNEFTFYIRDNQVVKVDK